MSSEFTSRDFSSPTAYDFARKLRDASPSGSRRFSELFPDFCTMAAISLRQGVVKMCRGEIDAELEGEYMATVKKYDADKLKHFPEAMALLTLGIEGTMKLGDAGAVEVGGRGFTGDFLGGVFEATGCSNDYAGQFFTPWPISAMMARMTLGEVKPDPAHRLTIQEPAVGAGAMLLAAAEVLREADFSPRRWWFSATDIDRRCFHMAYIQLSLTGCPGVVRLGNSLSSAPCTEAWLTFTGAMFPYRPEADTVDVANLPHAHSVEETTARVEAMREGMELALQAPAAPESHKEPPKRAKQPQRAASAPAGAISASQDSQLSLF